MITWYDASGCPFCGAGTRFLHLRSKPPFRVRCARCGATGPEASTPEDAVTLWNDRPDRVACQTDIKAEVDRKETQRHSCVGSSEKVSPDRVGILFEEDFPRKTESILRDTLNIDVSISCADDGFLKRYEVSNDSSRTIRFAMDPFYFYDFDTEDDLFKFWFYRFKELMSVGSYSRQAVQGWDEEVSAPVKDRNTVPWMSATEIPAVKLVLSEWRRLRKERNSNHYPHVGSANLENYVKDAATLLNYVAVSEKKLKEEMER